MVRHNGFTLIELLLSIATTSIVLMVVVGLLQHLLSAQTRNQTITEVEQTGARIMSLMTQSIRNADTVNSPTTGASASSLSLAVPDAGQNPTVFDISSSTLRITTGASSAIQLSPSSVLVTQFTAENYSRAATSGILRIQFTLSHTNPSNRPEYAYSKTFSATASLR